MTAQERADGVMEFFAEHPDALTIPPHPNVLTGGTWRYVPKDDTVKHKAWLKREEENRVMREREKEAHQKAEDARKLKIEEGKALAAVGRR